MAIEIENDTIISITELAATLETKSDYMKKALKEAGIPVLAMNRRPGQQYVALRAIHNYLTRDNGEE